MLQLLETGQALYVLAAVCLSGIFTRLMTKNIYKGLIKESANMTMAKNKSLKELKLSAENTYRTNQGIRDSGIWLEHQLYQLKFRGMTLSGWGNLSVQLTWLCLLLGGIGAFSSYWYRLDTFYIVLYGGGAVLMSMFTMLFDSGAANGKREQLTAALQDYMENTLCPRLSRSLSDDGGRNDNMDSPRAKVRSLSRLTDRVATAERGNADKGSIPERQDSLERGPDRSGFGERPGARAAAGNSGKKANRNARRETAATASGEESGTRRDMDYLKRSLEQIAASREKGRKDKDEENWLKNLEPEEVQLIGDILKEYLA